MCVFLASSLSFYMNLIMQDMVTWIFTKCLLWTKLFLSLQHSHLASMLCCRCWFSWVLLCWPQTLYWSLLRKPHPDLKQRRNSCSPNNWVFFCFVVGEGSFFGGRVVLFFGFLPCTNYAPLTQRYHPWNERTPQPLSRIQEAPESSLSFFIVAIAPRIAHRDSLKPPQAGVVLG